MSMMHMAACRKQDDVEEVLEMLIKAGGDLSARSVLVCNTCSDYQYRLYLWCFSPNLVQHQYASIWTWIFFSRDTLHLRSLLLRIQRQLNHWLRLALIIWQVFIWLKLCSPITAASTYSIRYLFLHVKNRSFINFYFYYFYF